MHSDFHFDRRHLIKAGAVAGICSTSPINNASGNVQTASAVDQQAETESNPLRIGCIGTGGRWGSVGRAAMAFGQVVAVCDVDRGHLSQAAQIVAERQGKAPETYENYEELLQRTDIDIVTIVTPDHWHAKLAIEAMLAEKDVYCEKPLTLTIDEGKRIIETLERTGRVFQVGTQQRTEFEKRFLTAAALCRTGRLGKIQSVTCRIGGAPSCESLPEVEPPVELNWDRWLGPAPLVPYRFLQREKGRPATRCHYEFRWWYEYSGGKMTDWGAHHVDIAQWCLGKEDTGPTLITPVHAEHPVPLDELGMPTDTTRYNTATSFQVKCQYDDGVELMIQSDGPNGIELVGDQGTLFVGRNQIRGDAYDQLTSNPIPPEFMQQMCKGELPHGPHPHMRNFFASVASRQQPISDVYSHHRSMTICHLANIANRLGRAIRWDPESQQIIDDPQAASMQAREARTQYV